ncbi:MAG: DegT/DnrJ/EryC1/StrS family aminotransferase [Verrucomicrobium sp.]
MQSHSRSMSDVRHLFNLYVLQIFVLIVERHLNQPSMRSVPRFSAYPLEDALAHQEEIHEALQNFIQKGSYILGPEVTGFEEEFAAYVKVSKVVGVANGTDAIEVMLRAVKIGPGDRVAVPSHTAVASASGICRAGAVPVYVDIDPDTFTLCPESLKSLLQSPEGQGIKAVLAVHLYGHPCDMDRLEEICGRRGIALLEDCAQAHGARYKGRMVGSLGRAAAFSFYPTKNLGALGDGGAVATQDDELAAEMLAIRQYGWKERYISASQGVNSRLDEMQAAILRIKLRSLPAGLQRRRELAMLYGELLNACQHIVPPIERPECDHAYHLYVIRSPHRDALVQHLTGKGVPVAVHYPAAIHQQPGYAEFAAASAPLPVTEAAMKEILTLPLHPYLDEEAVRYACAAIREFSPY